MKKVKSIWSKLRVKMTKRWWAMTIYQVITFILSVAIVYGVVNYAVVKSYRARKLALSDSFTVTAHTGSMGTEENSIASIEKAIEIGADVVEFDVRFQSDGTPVMAHDGLLAGGKKSVTVEEAFQALTQDGVKINVNLDLKETSHVDRLEELVKQYSLLERCFYTGVTEKMVDDVRSKSPDIPYYLNYSPSRNRLLGDKYQHEVISVLRRSGAIGINCNYIYSGERLANLLHENGYLLSVWTVNNKDQMARALVNGADNITSKVPDQVIHLIETWNDRHA